LSSCPGCSFVSLQLGPPAQQLAGVAPGLIRDVSSRLHDWRATADLVAGLDLVITVDTAVAHLAGALSARSNPATGRVRSPKSLASLPAKPLPTAARDPAGRATPRAD
jgi:hypothetical protein